MGYFVKNIQTNNELFKYQYAGTDLNNLASSVDSLMIKEGYKISTGVKGNGQYEKGNRLMRILFGAFVKYFKYSISLKQLEDGSLELLVVKASSGMSGGLIGMGQVKKELQRLSEIFATI